MDVIFNCPKCEQELAVESTGSGRTIYLPADPCRVAGFGMNALTIQAASLNLARSPLLRLD